MYFCPGGQGFTGFPQTRVPRGQPPQRSLPPHSNSSGSRAHEPTPNHYWVPLIERAHHKSLCIFTNTHHTPTKPLEERSSRGLQNPSHDAGLAPCKNFLIHLQSQIITTIPRPNTNNTKLISSPTHYEPSTPPPPLLWSTQTPASTRSSTIHTTIFHNPTNQSTNIKYNNSKAKSPH